MFSSVSLLIRGWRRISLLATLLLSSVVLPARADAPPAAPATSPSSTSSSASTTAPLIADLVAEFQRVEAAARALDPQSLDAISRLRSLVEQLAHANAQLARDLAQLRSMLEARSPTPPARTATPAGNTTARTPAARPQAARLAPGAPTAPASASEATGTGFFAKRGLKKFHRAGCIFGEKIKAEDRVVFPTAAAAAGGGLEPCKVCRPQ